MYCQFIYLIEEQQFLQQMDCFSKLACLLQDDKSSERSKSKITDDNRSRFTIITKQNNASSFSKYGGSRKLSGRPCNNRHYKSGVSFYSPIINKSKSRYSISRKPFQMIDQNKDPNLYDQFQQTINFKERQNEIRLKTQTILQLYQAKCQDIKITFSEQQAAIFLKKFKQATNHRRINLNNSNIGYQAFCCLCSMLFNDQNYYYLNVQKNQIKDQGAYEMAKLILSNQSLCYVNIASNAIKQPGAQAIFNALKGNTHIVELDISSKQGLNKNIVGDGTKSLIKSLSENSTLQILNLSNTLLTFKGLKYLVEGLKLNKSLLVLDIGYNQLLQTSIPLIITILKTHQLEDLNIAGNNIGNFGIKKLFEYLNLQQKSLKLKKLNLSDNNITTRSGHIIFQTLRRNISLRKIIFDRNCFNSDIKGLTIFLQQNHYIEQVSFEHCNMDKKICESIGEGLKKAKSIQRINLSFNKLQYDAIHHIFRCIQYNDSLEKLELKNCQIEDQAIQILNEGLKRNRSLRSINLSNNFINDRGGSRIIEALESNKYVKQINLTSNLISYKILNIINNRLQFNRERELNQKLPRSRLKLFVLQETIYKEDTQNKFFEKSIQYRKNKLQQQIDNLQKIVYQTNLKLKQTQCGYQKQIKELDTQIKQLNKAALDQKYIQSIDDQIQDIEIQIENQKKRIQELEKMMIQIQKDKKQTVKPTKKKRNGKMI